MIVIMNCLSTSPPCSEIDSGNHHFPLTNIQTERIVITQIAIPRRRPIRCLLLTRLSAKGIEPSETLSDTLRFALTRSAHSPIKDHHTEQQGQVKDRCQQQLPRVLI